jgi:toxin CcdB
MAQFDVFRNGSRSTRQSVPYLLDLQADLLAGSVRCIVAPLVLQRIMTPLIKRLYPVFAIEGNDVAMSTLELVSVPRGVLGARVTSLADRRGDILAAIDLLFFGI